MRIHRVVRLTGIVALLLLGGCLSKTAVLEDFQYSGSLIGLTVVDARPPEDKVSEFLSTWIGSCDLGIYRIGDNRVSPSRLLILQRDLETALGSRLANSSVAISRYRIFLNQGNWFRGLNEGQGGVIRPIVVGALSAKDCTKEKNSGGWYAASEVTNDNSPIIIEINARVSDRDFAVRTVYSPSISVEVSVGDPPSAAQLFKAIAKAHAALIDQMQHSL